MDNKLYLILTNFDGQILADKLTDYFGRTFTQKEADVGKKTLCCNRLAQDKFLVALETNALSINEMDKSELYADTAEAFAHLFD